MNGTGPPEILGIRQHLVARHRLLAAATPHDELGRLLDLEHARSGDAERERALEQLSQGLLETVPLPAFGEVGRLGRRERQPLGLRRLLDRRRPATLVRRRLEAGKEGVHGDLRAVDRPLLKLVDRLHGRGQLLRLARQLLVGLVHGEREGRDHVAVRGLPDRHRSHVGRARGEGQVGEHRQADDPKPAAAVIARLLLCREPHVSPVRPPRRRG